MRNPQKGSASWALHDDSNSSSSKWVPEVMALDTTPILKGQQSQKRGRETKQEIKKLYISANNQKPCCSFFPPFFWRGRSTLLASLWQRYPRLSTCTCSSSMTYSCWRESRKRRGKSVWVLVSLILEWPPHFCQVVASLLLLEERRTLFFSFSF